MGKFRIIYNFLIILIFLIGIIKLINGEYYLAFVWILFTPLMMLLPRNLYKIHWVYQNYNKNLVYTFEKFILVFLLTGAGYTLGLKHLPIDFDSLFHFINLLTMSIAVSLVYYIIKNRLTKKEVTRKEIIIFTFIFNVTFGVVLWERFQFYNDQVFGTNMFYDYFQDANIDTLLDQLFGLFGVIIGSFLIYFRFDDWINKLRR